MRLRNRGHAAGWELLALLDNFDEFDWDVAGHVRQCELCARRLEEERRSNAWIREKMAMLVASNDIDVETALSDARRRINERQSDADSGGGNRVIDFWGQRTVRVATAVAALAVMVVSLSFTPMRTVAEDFLRQMRVREFAAVTIPMDMVKPFESAMLEGMSEADRERLHEELAQLGTFETTFDFDLEHLPQTMTLDEARAAYGEFDVPETLPDGFAAEPEVYVTEAGSASYTLDVANAQNLIDEMGLPFYSLPDPAEHPTLTFTANLPAAVVQHYMSDDGKHVVVGQMQSPTLDIPQGIDMDDVREDVLRFPGLPADLVAQLRAIDNWEETLIIPIPEGARSENIEIDGEPGLLIESAEGSAVLWEKDGVLHAVVGQVSADEIRDIADSLR